MSFKYPLYIPNLEGKESEYVNDCLSSSWISSKGKYIELFEKEFANYVGSNYAIAVSNGTVAIHAALVALGVGTGDEVLVPSFTYIAPVNAIRYTGATPIFVEIDKTSGLMDPEDIRLKITSKTKVILPVHLYSDLCDMSSIKSIAEQNQLQIIEDCAESLGTWLNDKHSGSFGTLATYSFYGNKTVTTGEGGMITTNDEELAITVRKIKGQGLAEGREYWHDIIGYNYRMTNICAAIGLAQMERIELILNKKRQLAKWYNESLRDLPVQLPVEAEGICKSYWIYNIYVSSNAVRNRLREALKNAGIETRPTFHPVHQMPMYKEPGQNLPISDELSSRGINLPSYPDLTKDDILVISSVIRDFYKNS